MKIGFEGKVFLFEMSLDETLGFVTIIVAAGLVAAMLISV
jgi:hypothetical protein